MTRQQTYYCYVCRKTQERPRRCDECKEALRQAHEAHRGESRVPPPCLVAHEVRIARLAARAAAELPLFGERTQ